MGKTHPAVALGLQAIHNGYGVCFVTVDEMGVYAMKPVGGKPLLPVGLRTLREGQHHPDFEQGVR